MAKWYDINGLCQNCGKPLQAAWDYPKRESGALGYIEGCRPVKYRHQDKTQTCIKRWPKPRAFSDWDTNRSLEEADE